jgi:hypothetical protein
MSEPTSTPAPAPSGGPRLSYDLPQEVSYSGQSFIELALEPEYFIAQARSAGRSITNEAS